MSLVYCVRGSGRTGLQLYGVAPLCSQSVRQNSRWRICLPKAQHAKKILLHEGRSCAQQPHLLPVSLPLPVRHNPARPQQTLRHPNSHFGLSEYILGSCRAFPVFCSGSLCADCFSLTAIDTYRSLPCRRICYAQRSRSTHICCKVFCCAHGTVVGAKM